MNRNPDFTNRQIHYGLWVMVLLGLGIYGVEEMMALSTPEIFILNLVLLAVAALLTLAMRWLS